MINFLFPIINLIDRWIALLLPFPLQNLFWGLIAGTLAFIIYLLLSNQTTISNIKSEMKIVRKSMFDPALEDKAEYNKLAKRNVVLSFNLLGKIFFPAIISILPILIIAIWYDMHYSYQIPYYEDPVAVGTEPKDMDFDIEHNGFTSENITSATAIIPQGSSDFILVYNADSLIYSGQPFKAPIPFITKRNWWNFILSNPVGYIEDKSPIEVLIFNYPEKIQFSKFPKLINGWELLFFVGIFISAISLRIVFKVQ